MLFYDLILFLDNSYVGIKAIAAGWGSTAEQKNHSCRLMDVELPVLSNEACRNTKYESAMIADHMLCAGYPDKGIKDTCQVNVTYHIYVRKNLES